MITIRCSTWGDEGSSADTKRRRSEAASGPDRLPSIHAEPDELRCFDFFRDALFSRKFLVLLVVVISINACWHVFRVWLPKFLVKRGAGTLKKIPMFEINFLVSTS